MNPQEQVKVHFVILEGGDRLIKVGPQEWNAFKDAVDRGFQGDVEWNEVELTEDEPEKDK